MKKLRAFVVIAVLVALLGGCGFITGLFGPSKNNILSWVKNIKDGTVYQIQERYSAGGESDTYEYTIEIVDVDERETKTIIRAIADGGDYYLIADDARGELVQSFDDIVDDTDQVLLEVPVEEGGSWVSYLHSYILYVGIPDRRFTIEQMKGTRDAGTEVAKDVVVVSVNLTDVWSETTFSTAEVYFSPTYGWLGDRYVFQEDGVTYTYETMITDIDIP